MPVPLALLCKQNSCNIHLHNNDYTPMWATNHALIVFCSFSLAQNRRKYCHSTCQCYDYEKIVQILEMCKSNQTTNAFHVWIWQINYHYQFRCWM